MRRLGWFVLLIVGCGSEAGPEPEPLRGPERAVSEDRVCTYTYDEADRLIDLDIDDGRHVEYAWIGPGLDRIVVSRDGAPVLTWANNDAGGSDLVVIGTTYTMDARVALPPVLVCDVLAAAQVYMTHPSWPQPGVPDRFLTRTIDGQAPYTYTYTGVEPGENGERVRDDGYESQNVAIVHRYTYSEHGLASQFEDGEDPWNAEHELLDDGRFASTTYSHDDVTYWTELFYDDAGNLLEIVTTDDGVDERHVEAYEYE